MTLFPDNKTKSTRRQHAYSKGFIKAYEAFGVFVEKYESFVVWQDYRLEPQADEIADKAFAFHRYCKIKGIWQKHFRRWLKNRGWEDELWEAQPSYTTPKDAYDAFKLGEWTHCDGIDCTKQDIKWNRDWLLLSANKIIPKNEIRNRSFLLRFDVR